MNPAIHYELARERQALLARDARTERLTRRVTDPARSALAARVRDALLPSSRFEPPARREPRLAG
ncbi:MAG TPA: hypothetical protein VGJ27_02450 [Gaiellaceae bacterium]|jgi:hypothetical protein